MARTVLALFALAASALAQDTAVRRARPDADGGPTKIHVAVMVADIDAIDSAEQIFQANIAIAARWKDPRLAHNETGAKVVALHEIWHPDLLIVNLASGRVTRKTLPLTAEVSPDGTVVQRQRYVGSFSQPVDLADFPFDSHTFRVHFASASYTPSELAFVADRVWVDRGLADAIHMTDQLSLPDWELRSMRAGALPYVLAPEVGRAGYAFEFDADRHWLYFFWRMIVPLVLIMIMSWTVFWIDPSQAGTQVSVSVTSMLTLIAFQLVIDQLIPPVSYMTRLGMFLQLSTLLVFLALIEVIITTRLAQQGQHDKGERLDVISRVGFPIGLVAVLLVSFVF